MKVRTKTNLFIDITIFIVFLIVYEEKATGTTIHEWLGVTLAIFFIVHIILHWRWLTTCTKQFLKPMKNGSRLNYILDILIYFGFTTIIFSGLMISESFLPFFGFGEGRNHYWQEIHIVSVDITLFLVAFHFALHWKWIVKNCKRYIIGPFISQTATVHIKEQAVHKTGKSAAWSLSNLAKSGYQFIFILALSGLISYGWYALAGSGPSEIFSREFRQGRNRNYESRFHSDTDRGFERFEGNRRGRRNGNGHLGDGRHFGEREHHHEGGIFGIEILKNLVIFTLITIVVAFFTTIFKNKKVSGQPTSG